MSEYQHLTPLVEAIRRAQADPEPVTRLATITGGTASTVTVRFDGETSASARQYQIVYSGAKGGDRAIMLRVGSTWVAIGSIGSPGKNVDAMDLTFTNGCTGVAKLSRRANVVDVVMHANSPAGGLGGNAAFLIIPAEHRPITNSVSRYKFGVDSATGNSILVYYNSPYILTTFSRPAGTTTIAEFSWVAQD